MNTPIFQSVHLDITGEDGNAFMIMAVVLKCLLQSGYSKNELEELQKEMMSSDYDHLCQIARKYIYLDGE